jgi:glycosyltransferase involved in cell wall biosynthesis
MYSCKASICIPTYNQPDFLKLVLDSIVIQSFKDYEVIISDDSTNNESQALVESYRLKIPNLTYIKNEPSKKSPGSWNEAIRHAKGEYIKVMHSDDWFNGQDSLHEFVDMLDTHPESDFAFSGAAVCGPDHQTKFIHAATSREIEHLKKSPSFLFGRNIVGAPSATIYRTLVTYKYYDEKMKWVVDLDQYIGILNKNQQFAYTQKPLVCTTDGAGHQSIHGSVGLKQIELFEWLRLYSKLREQYGEKLKYKPYMWIYLLFILERCGVTRTKDLEDIEMKAEEKDLVTILLRFTPLFFVFKIRRFIVRVKSYHA